jgi:hypothetical protein
MAMARDENLRCGTWPGDGPVDARLLTIAGHLVLAHDLIERRLCEHWGAELVVGSGCGRCSHPEAEAAWR